jgi:hypothetical protein
MPFVKGQSGNPAGRPVGSRNRFTREMDEALEKRGVALIDAVVAHAHSATPAAMRLCLDRLLPVGKHRPATIELPPAETPDYTMAALGEVQRALAAGEISTDEGTRLLGFVERVTRILAAKAVADIDLAARLARCEEALGLAAPAADAKADAEPVPETAGVAAVDISSNNAETMAAATKAGPPVAAAPAEAAPITRSNEKTIAAALAPADARPRRHSAVDRLMDSTSPLAQMAGVLPTKGTRAVPPRMPLAGAA